MNDDQLMPENPADPDKASTMAVTVPAVRKAGSTSILVAALSGLSMALGWENHREESTIAVDVPDDQGWLDLDVGPLDQLGHTEEP